MAVDDVFYAQQAAGGQPIDNELVDNTASATGKAKRQRVTAFSGSPFPVRSWGQFYNLRGQRHIATTGYIQQTANTSEPLALFKNVSTDMVVLFDKIEFGSTYDVRFSRYAGGTTPLVGTPTKRPIGRTDGGTSTSTAEIYTGGPAASSQFLTSGGTYAPGTLRKVAVMQAYESYMLDLGGTSVLRPGSQAYWMTDEATGGVGGTYNTYIDFEWVEVPLANFNAAVAALQAKAEF